MMGVSVRSLLSVLLVATVVIVPRAQQSDPVDKLLLGQWTLVSWLVTDDSGRTSEPYGAEPEGTMSYVASGELGIHVRNPAETRPDTSAVNPNVALARLGSMQFSYNGTFELDESTMTIAHRVEHSTSVARLGKTYTWLLESIDTDNLVLSAKLGNETGMPASLRGLNSTRWQRTP